MKALSLWQPWASAMAVGAKTIETRSWGTSYRGPLAIHAAKRCIKDELIDVQSSWGWCGALYDLGVRMGQVERLWDLLPFGAIIAIAYLDACRRSETFTGGELDTPRVPLALQEAEGLGEAYAFTERMMGNFSPGRYGWEFSKVDILKTPIPCRGYQQLFEVEI
jgi:hypothetical protein